jgi:hypothetical protein
MSRISEALSREYSDVKFDLVIVAAYPALQFAIKHRDQIFPGVPVLFCYVHGGRLEGKQLWPGVTGVTISIGVRETLDLSFRLHPGTQNLAVVAGTSEFERYWRTAVRNEFVPYGGKVKLIEIVGLGNNDILKQVAALPPHTVVLFLVMPRDSSQPEVGLYDTVAAIGQRLPTYCIFNNFCIDHGGIVGSFADYAEQSSRTAELAASPPQISRSDLAPPSWQNSMATNCPQLLNPRACRSALCLRTAVSKPVREISCKICEKMLHTLFKAESSSDSLVFANSTYQRLSAFFFPTALSTAELNWTRMMRYRLCCEGKVGLDVLQLSRLLARDVKESRNGNPARNLQMAADRTRPHALCGPVVSSLFSLVARC